MVDATRRRVRTWALSARATAVCATAVCAAVVCAAVVCAAVVWPGFLSGAPAARAGIVDARDYDSFWLWAGVHAPPILAAAKRVYLLEGEVKLGPPIHLVSRRPAIPSVKGADVWLVVRAETLAWSPDIYETLADTLTRWRAAGNKVVGVQIDFDARTRHVASYASFLSDLRGRLPRDCKLGVTGLLDWSANADPAGLAALAGSVDEVVLQIYQGRHVISGYAVYLRKLDRLPMAFRIGLLEGGEWTAPPGLGRNPRFEGYVVFLRNE